MLAAIGAGAMVAPRRSAAVFGIEAESPDALAFVRACGGRDLVLGALLAASLGEPAALRRALVLVSLVGVLDAIVLAAARGPRPAHALHLGGAAAMAWAAQRDDRA